jgi:hypothetical protein
MVLVAREYDGNFMMGERKRHVSKLASPGLQQVAARGDDFYRGCQDNPGRETVLHSLLDSQRYIAREEALSRASEVESEREERVKIAHFAPLPSTNSRKSERLVRAVVVATPVFYPEDPWESGTETLRFLRER